MSKKIFLISEAKMQPLSIRDPKNGQWSQWNQYDWPGVSSLRWERFVEKIHFSQEWKSEDDEGDELLCVKW